jgi:hypothetical protein
MSCWPTIRAAEGVCVPFIVAGRDGEGRISGSERKMSEVTTDVTRSE